MREGKGHEENKHVCFQAARQELPARLSLLSGGDPLHVVSSAIKPSGLFIAHM